MFWPEQPKHKIAMMHPARTRRHKRTMSLKIPVAHDFICPWCWVGLVQAKRLEGEFGATIDWLGYELWPAELEWPDHKPGPEPPANKPVTPNRFEFILISDGLEIPKAERPKKMRTFNAHQAVEYAKTEGVANILVESFYHALWRRGENINDVAVIKELASGTVKDIDALVSAVETQKFRENVVHFDDDAYAAGIYNVPTFFIGGLRYAEQPYSVLRQAVKKELDL